MLKPNKMDKWEAAIDEKLGEFQLIGARMDKIKTDLYAVFIDRIAYDMVVNIKSEQKDGLMAFLLIHRWYMETSGQGMARKRTYVMEPPQVKHASEINDAVLKWERELEDFIKMAPPGT